MLVRNDDVFYGMDLGGFKRFCELCDKYGVGILQAITPIGDIPLDSRMTNSEIRAMSSHKFTDNIELYSFLKSRNDLIGVHGLYHTHYPTSEEILESKKLLESWGFSPTYYVPPFNEYNGEDTHGLTVSVMSMTKGERLEDYIVGMPRNKETPPEFCYLHSWRFDDGKWYKLDNLEEKLKCMTSK